MSEQAEIQAPPSAAAPAPSSRPRKWPETVIALGVILAFCYFAEWELVVVLVSILISFILAPVVDQLQKLRIPRGVGSAIAVGLLLAVGYGVAYYSYNQTTSFIENLPQYSKEIQGVIGKFKQRAEKLERTTEKVLETNPEKTKTVTVQQATSWTDKIANSFGSLSHDILALSFVPFLVYFMLTWQQHARSATVMLFRMENRHTAYTTLNLISAMIRSFILGNFLVGLFIAGVSTVVFALLQLPFFYVVGVISGFLSLVPYLGVMVAMVPPLIVGAGHLGSSQLIIIALTVLALHIFGINILYPKFLGSRLQLNPLAVTIALLFWGWLWGAMGLILAIPITAAMKIIFDHIDALHSYGNWLGE